MSDPNKPSRRAFLRGRATSESLSRTAQSSWEQTDEPPGTAPDAQPYLIRVGRQAMACNFEVLLNAGQYPEATEVVLQALDRIDLLEAQLSVYREESEICQVNRLAASRPVRVEQGLFDLLVQAVRFHSNTHGAFDVTSAPLSQAWGFWRREGRMPSLGEIEDAKRQVGSQFLQLDIEEQTVHFSQPGLQINLGSIGKGYALDCCAELLEAAGIDDYFFHGGQSSVMSRGSRVLRNSSALGWDVGLSHPLRPERRVGEVFLLDQSLGTSGDARQFFYHKGKRYGHILDPRTGWPAQEVLSTTVVANSAATADALATAFFIMGVDASLEYCRQHEGISVVLMTSGERTGSLEIVSHGFEKSSLNLC